jgi:hypothetical protein
VATYIRVRELEDEFGEWRYHAAGRVVDDLPDRGPGRREKKAGAFLSTTRTAVTSGGDVFSFTDFSAVALSLSIAISADEKAKELQAALHPTEFTTETGTYRTIPEEELSVLYDFIEQMFVAVTFSYQALESFCNFTIEDRLRPNRTHPITMTKCNKTTTTAMQADEIERKCSTRDKLADIVPDLLKMGSPKSKAIWSEYLKLERVRDGIIHMKYADHQNSTRVPRAIDSNKLFYDMVRGEYQDLPKSAVKLLDHFTRHIETPRWLRHPLAYYELPVPPMSEKIVTLRVDP